MQLQRLPWRTGLAACALVGLASCGGGGVIAALGFAGSAGGDWLQDDQPSEQAGSVGLQLRSTCGAGGNEVCRINIQPVGGQPLFEESFDLTFNGANVAGCPATGTGRANGRRLTLDGCFVGAYVNINQAVSDNGVVRMFFNFTPDLSTGIWHEIQRGQRRFVFDGAGGGCELTAPATTPLTITLSPADILDAAGPFETTVASFSLQGGGGAWQGRFVGVSGLRLTRGNELLELERRQGTEDCDP